MSPERNYGYEMVEQNEELKHILDSSSQIESAFDYEKYGRAYTEGGEVTVLEDGYMSSSSNRKKVATTFICEENASSPKSAIINHPFWMPFASYGTNTQ